VVYKIEASVAQLANCILVYAYSGTAVLLLSDALAQTKTFYSLFNEQE